MSLISYNGIQLEFVSTGDISYESKYDESGLDYLYTLISIKVRAVLNPGATSYINNSSGTPDPVATPGQNPATTIEAIQNALAQPRGQLIFSNGTDFISSPSYGAEADIIGGPYPRVLRINKISGASTFMVDFEVQTAINECVLASPIISNRWSSHWNTDQEMRTEIAVEGSAVLALNWLLDQNINPGSLIPSILPYVLPNFFREQISIQYLADLRTIKYSYRDRERYFYQLGSLSDPQSVASRFGVTSMRCAITQQTTSMSNSTGGHVMANPGWSRVGIDGSIIGSEYSDRGKLSAFATFLVQEKLSLIQQLSKGTILENVMFRQSYSEPVVDFSVVSSVQSNNDGIVPWTGYLNKIMLFNDPNFSFLPKVGTNPQLRWGGLSQIYNTQLVPVVQGLLQACETPCALAIPFGLLQDVCSGPGLLQSYLVSPPTIVTAPPIDASTLGQYQSLIDYNNTIFRYTIRKRTTTKYHTLQLPTTAPPSIGNGSLGALPNWSQLATGRPASEIVSLAAPTSQLVIDWTAESYSDYPPVPSANTSDTNLVLAESEVGVYHIDIAKDGITKLMRIEGKYTFFNPVYATAGVDALGSSSPPYLQLAYNNKGVSAQLFMGGIVDDGSGDYSGASPDTQN